MLKSILQLTINLF